MGPCDSKVFFPDDPRLAPQFSDCPRQAVTTRRAFHSVVKLCPKCAQVWDEQEQALQAEKAYSSAGYDREEGDAAAVLAKARRENGLSE